jgi:hypothetical protein
MRDSYSDELSSIELNAAELESKKGQKSNPLGDEHSLVRDNGESDELSSSCMRLRLMHVYE